MTRGRNASSEAIVEDVLELLAEAILEDVMKKDGRNPRGNEPSQPKEGTEK